jgi:hypothetical protein
VGSPQKGDGDHKSRSGGVGRDRRIHGATPRPCLRRRQGDSAPLIKYPSSTVLFKMPQKYALLWHIRPTAAAGGVRHSTVDPSTWSGYYRHV